MMYKNKHFLTTSQHIKYLIEVEKLSDFDVSQILRELWNCKNLEIATMLKIYYESKEESK